MEDITEKYSKALKIDEEKALARRLVPTENGLRTQIKEMIGEAVIKKHHLFETLFPNLTGYKKVTNKKLQKAGADYEIYTEDQKDPIYIDLKSLVGPCYNMAPEDFDEVEVTEDLLKRKAITLELYQNGVFTNAGKITDYFLYTICDSTGIWYYMISYQEARDICLKHKDSYIIDKERGVGIPRKHFPFTRYISNNKTGKYIKYCVNATQLERQII